MISKGTISTVPGENMSKLIGIPDKEEEIERVGRAYFVPDTIQYAEAAGVLPFCVEGGASTCCLTRKLAPQFPARSHWHMVRLWWFDRKTTQTHFHRSAGTC